MAERSKQKLKLIYLMQILMEKTDETHSITMSEIISALKSYGITAERKSLYDDIECLRTYGLEIIGTQEGRTYCYQVVNRQFELAELKLSFIRPFLCFVSFFFCSIACILYGFDNTCRACRTFDCHGICQQADGTGCNTLHF